MVVVLSKYSIAEQHASAFFSQHACLLQALLVQKLLEVERGGDSAGLSQHDLLTWYFDHQIQK